VKIAQQNSEWSIQRLLAEDTLRTRSARMQWARITLSLATAVAAPALAATGYSGQPYLALIGAAVALISGFILEAKEDSYRRAAVECKEQFDASLFDIKPTTGPRGSLLTEEEICALATKRNDARGRFRNWYPDPGTLPHGLAVLLCQRASLVWDMRLRRRYAACCLAVVGGWLGLGLGVSVVADLSLRRYLLIWFAPSTALLIIGVKAAVVHRDIANRRERLLALLSSEWNAARKQKRDVGMTQIRALQAAIFQIRADAPVLPAFFTNRHSASFYAHMAEASKQLQG
jgi:hypothetical protein